MMCHYTRRVTVQQFLININKTKMNKIQRFLFIALAAMMLVGTSYAQRDTTHKPPHNPGDTIHKPPHDPNDTTHKPPHDPRDTTHKPPHDPGDTNHKPPGNPNDTNRKPPSKAPCHILSDSCKQIFFALIPAADAQSIDQSLADIDRLKTALNGLNAQFKAAREAKDTAQMRTIRGQIKDLRTQLRTAYKGLGDMLRKYRREFGAAADSCCGHRKPPSADSKDQGLLKISPIVPNPVAVGATSAQFNYSLAYDTNIKITINDQLGNEVKNEPLQTATAGDHTFILDLAGLPQGGYLVRMQAGNAVRTQRLIIQ